MKIPSRNAIMVLRSIKDTPRPMPLTQMSEGVVRAGFAKWEKVPGGNDVLAITEEGKRALEEFGGQ